MISRIGKPQLQRKPNQIIPRGSILVIAEKYQIVPMPTINHQFTYTSE